MNYCGFSKFDTANGSGVRVSLFVSGCTLHCKGCFNKESWDFNAGKLFDEKAKQMVIDALKEPYVSGLSVLGGDPFEEQNLPVVTDLLKAVREVFGKTKDIWVWTGRKIDHLDDDLEIWKYIDILIDGPFIEKQKETRKGTWRGSTNQRLIPISYPIRPELSEIFGEQNERRI